MKVAELEKAAADAASKAVAADRRAALTGKVADPVAALKLLDETKHLTDDGVVNVDAILADYPFLAPSKPSQVATPGAGGVINRKLDPAAMDAKDFAELQKRVLSGERVTL